MCKAKSWTMLVGAFLLSIFALEVLLAEPPIPDPKNPLDEGSWVGITGGGGSAWAPKAPQKANYYLIQFAPTGGFYLIKFSVPTVAIKKPAIKQN